MMSFLLLLVNFHKNDILKVKKKSSMELGSTYSNHLIVDNNNAIIFVIQNSIQRIIQENDATNKKYFFSLQ